MEKEKEKIVDVVEKKQKKDLITSEISGVSLEVSKDAELIIKEGFKKAGIVDEKPFKVLSEGLEAVKITYDKFGDARTEVDYATRHKYLVTTLELMRILKTKDGDTNNSLTIQNIKLTIPEDFSSRINGIKEIEL